jgi:uncharacterized protein YaaN involved in tellurite resistance
MPDDTLNPTPPASLAPMTAGSGLSPAPVSSALVADLVAQLEDGSLESVHSFGRDLGAATTQQADALLGQIQSRELEVIGGHLSQIVVAAKTLNLGPLSEQRSRIPLIGGLLDKVKLKSEGLRGKFQDVRAQIETLLAEVQTMQGGLAQRVEMLEHNFESVRNEHALLGAHIEAGGIAQARLAQRLAMDSALASSDPLQAQALQDRKTALSALEKRVSDLRVLQHAALQQLPMIRMVQSNNRMLIEKFYTIKELTVPAWKRQFTLALTLGEQKNAVELANSIDDATNEFLRENARLLKTNTLATAKANQRLVIDIDTLKEVHDSLMSTVQDVLRINQEGLQMRGAAQAQLQTMRQQLTQQLGGA